MACAVGILCDGPGYQNKAAVSKGKSAMEKVQKAMEVLNFYRNQHYNAPSGTEEYALANAINDILPLVGNTRNCIEFDRKCPNCNQDIAIGWNNCPCCGQYVPRRN